MNTRVFSQPHSLSLCARFAACGRRLRAAAATAALVAATLAATAGTAHAQAKQLYVRGQLQHINGVNLPWMRNSGGSNYGHDIGPNHYTGYGYHYVSGDVSNYYHDIKNMHANVVRVWLFQDLQGLTFDGNGYISGLDATFLNNLKDMVAQANSNGLALELTLLNNNIAAQAGHVPHDGGGAIKNVLTDSNAQTALLNNAIKPLAKLFNGNYGVYGYDLINEANYAVTGLGSTPAACTWAQLHSFLYNAAQAIHGVSSGIQVTCSTDDANSYSSANFYNRFGGVGLNFYDYHSYSDSPSLFSLGSGGPYPSIDRPIVLAEYGPRTTGDWTKQNSVTDSFINQASSLGWAGALAWDYDPTGQDNLSLIYGINSWHNCCYTLQWYSINKFGL